MLFRTLSLFVALFMLTGCGYHIGFIKHPQIDSIAVAPVVNETAIYNASSDMRMRMTEVIMQDGTYKLSDQRNADAILHITVNNVSFADAGDASVQNEKAYKPEEWNVSVSASYKLVIPGQGEPLLSGSTSGYMRFQAGADIETGRQVAVRQACYEVARKIVYAVSEGW